MITVNYAIFFPFIVAALIPILYKRLSKLHIGWIVMTVPALLFIYLARYIPHITNGKTVTNTVYWIPSYDLNLTTHLDGLSLIFGLIITGIGTLVVLYSIYYLSKEESLKHFYIYLLLFMGGMLGVVFVDHMMLFYLFWEVTSISSFLLIAFWYQRKGSRYGAKKALLITISGGLAMLIGFLMIHASTGTFSIREVIVNVGIFREHQLFIPAMIMILLGAFTKSAQFPFHIWLPSAMEAPTPISAYLHSATMVKAGIYLVARFSPIFGGDLVWFWLVSGIGLLTLLWGAFCAIRQTDLKALLAYSTVSQLGLIMSLFGVGSISFNQELISAALYTQAIFAGLFHLINHSTFKGALFMVVGIVDYQLGTRDIRRLGGLMSFMPISFTVALIGSFSMAGLPPFNGFLSKEMFFTAMLKISELDLFSLDTWGILFPVIAWIASVFTFVYSLIIVIKTFLGEQSESLDKPTHEAPKGMLVAPVILALFVVGIFFFPNIVGDYLIYPAMLSIFSSVFAGEHLTHTISAWHGFNTELFMTIGIVILGTVIFLLLRYFKYVYKLFPEKWSFDALFHHGLEGLERISNKITSFYMTGNLKHYLSYIYLSIVIFIGGNLVYRGAFTFNFTDDANIHLFSWFLVAVIIVAAVMLIFVKKRLPAILLNGFIGYSVSMFYVLFRAPDLALTQIVVETASTALFLLCFYFLSEWKQDKKAFPFSIKNLIISVSVGVTVVLVALSVKSEKLFETISTYYENALELAGSRNIVNTILGDFRAFDTMLEVVVLCIAGLGVYSLVKIRKRKGAENLED